MSGCGLNDAHGSVCFAFACFLLIHALLVTAKLTALGATLCMDYNMVNLEKNQDQRKAPKKNLGERLEEFNEQKLACINCDLVLTVHGRCWVDVRNGSVLRDKHWYLTFMRKVEYHMVFSKRWSDQNWINDTAMQCLVFKIQKQGLRTVTQYICILYFSKQNTIIKIKNVWDFGAKCPWNVLFPRRQTYRRPVRGFVLDSGIDLGNWWNWAVFFVVVVVFTLAKHHVV